MFLNFLGNGSGFCVEKGNNAAFYKENDSILFLDFGENIFEKVVNQNLLDGISNIYVAITHLHGDHVGGLASLSLFNYFTKHTTTHLVPSYDITKDYNLAMLLELQGSGDEMIDFSTQNLDGKFSNIKHCEFRKVSHVPTIDSFAIHLELADGRTIYFSGDTNDENYVKSVVNNLKPLDEFYCDTCLASYENNVHLNIDSLSRIVPPDKRHQIYCMHIDDDRIYKLAKEHGFNVAKNIISKNFNQGDNHEKGY